MHKNDVEKKDKNDQNRGGNGSSQKKSQNGNQDKKVQGNKSNYHKRKYYNKNQNRNRNFNHSNKQNKSMSKLNFRKVSILVPLYNEEESLRPLVQEIKKSVEKLQIDYEILFVDDGSTDKSLGIIKELARNDNRIRYVSFRKNYGKSAALDVGFKNVKGDVIITMDADLQDDPAEIPNLLKKLQEGYDLVSGWKKIRFDPFIKKYSSRFFNYVTRLLTGIKLHDFNCGLKAYRKKVVKELDIHGELHRYIPVLADWKGFKVSEIVVKHHPRRYGKTKFGISRFFKGFLDLITVIFTTRYIQRPMHVFGLVGGIFFVIGVLINFYLSYEWFFEGQYIKNRPLFFLGILLIIVGIQFFSVGLLGEIMVHNSPYDKDYSIKDKK